MKTLKGLFTMLIILGMLGMFSQNRLEAVTYVTDTGGYAYDEARAATNLAPAIALSTVALAAIIALAVQNSHDHGSSSHSATSGHFDSSSSFSSSSSSSF